MTEMRSAGGKPYKVYGGTWFHAGTDDEVAVRLEIARVNNTRIRIYNGDVETGRSWLDEWHSMGTIGRSSGEIKIPLMIASSRSRGGPGLIEHCIVAIQDVQTKRWLYRHPKFFVPSMTVREIEFPGSRLLQGLDDLVMRGARKLASLGYTHGVYLPDGSNQANFKSAAQATRYVQFMHGERMAK
jgi:hypothetical protein